MKQIFTLCLLLTSLSAVSQDNLQWNENSKLYACATDFAGEKTELKLSGDELAQFDFNQYFADHAGDHVKVTASTSIGAEVIRYRFDSNVDAVSAFCNDYGLAKDCAADGAFLGVRTKLSESGHGAEIMQVIEGTAAQHAGLRIGDVIATVDDAGIIDHKDLSKEVRARQPKQAIAVKYFRNGTLQSNDITLGARKSEVYRWIPSCEFKNVQGKGIESLTMSTEVFPNPTSGIVNITLSGAENEMANLSIQDFSGKKLATEKIIPVNGNHQQQLDLSELPKGTYFIHIEQSSQQIMEKIVVQ